MRYKRITTVSMLMLGLLLMGGCDGLLDVEDPGAVTDADLNHADTYEGLVAGMQADLDVAVGELAPVAGIMADEWTFAATSSARINFQNGLIRDDQVGGEWNRIQRARWVAEDGIRRMTEVLEDAADQNEHVLKARILAGLANRVAGEMFCQDVFDGGPAEPHTTAFHRAEAHFTEAIRLAEIQGHTDLRLGALGGRASVRAWLGEWSAAAADAAQVPIDYQFDTEFWATGATFAPGGRGGNDVWREVFHRLEYTVYGSPWAEVEDDPRVPWWVGEDELSHAIDGVTPMYVQDKYPQPNVDIPYVQGTELVLLRAEAALRQGQVGDAVGFINQNRAHYGLDPAGADNESEAWQLLKGERAAEVWLEARRFWDLRRWLAEGRDDFLANRDDCIPISERERRTNPNID